MRVNSAIPSFYNASAKINAEADKVRAAKIQQMSGSASSGGSGSSGQRQSYISDEKRKLIQTKVSPENAYQKTMLNDHSFAMERVANKLMPHLDALMRDMNDLPEAAGIQLDDDQSSRQAAHMDKNAEKPVSKEEKINIEI